MQQKGVSGRPLFSFEYVHPDAAAFAGACRRRSAPCRVFPAAIPAELGVDVRGLSPETLELLKRHHWPGNVRELESAVKFALVHSTGDVVTPQALPGSVRGQPEAASTEPFEPEHGNLADVRSLVMNLLAKGSADLSETVHSAVDRILLEQVLASVGGHRRAAEILGLSRNTLRARLQQLGLTVGKVVQDESDEAR